MNANVYSVPWDGWQSLVMHLNDKLNLTIYPSYRGTQKKTWRHFHHFHTPIRREPLHGTYAEVECYIHNCLTEIPSLIFTPLKRSNLTPEEFRTLTNLQRRDDIVIKLTNKGDAVVMWDRNFYIEEAYKQLNNPTYYQKLCKPSVSADEKEISKIVRDLVSADQLPMTAKLLVKHQSKQPITQNQQNQQSWSTYSTYQLIVVPLNTSQSTLMFWNHLSSHCSPFWKTAHALNKIENQQTMEKHLTLNASPQQTRVA